MGNLIRTYLNHHDFTWPMNNKTSAVFEIIHAMHASDVKRNSLA
jgi:hypothetical protein